MSRALISRKPISTLVVSLASTNVTTAAWAQLVASLSSPATAVEVFNSGGRITQIALGGSGSEVALPYTILPGGTDGPIPFEFKSGQRLTAKAVDGNATTGYLVFNFFG